MKHLILFTFLLSSYFVSFSQTKLLIDRKDGTKDSIAVNAISQIRFSSPGVYQPSLLEVVTVLDSAKAKFIEYANLTNGDFEHTIYLTEYWLMTQPNIKSTFSMGDGYIYITLKSGLKTTFYFNAVDDNGVSIYRGGEGGSSLKAENAFIENAAEILSKNVIENKKVLLFETARDLDLEPQIKVITEILNNSKLDLKVTVLKYEQCTVEAAETFGDYGLVIIDGHGNISSFELGISVDLTNKPKTEESVINEIKTQLGAGKAAKVISGDIELVASVKANLQQSDWAKRIIEEVSYSISLSGKYIASLPPMPKTIIFGNMCYSGWLLKSIKIPKKKYVFDDNTVAYRPEKIETFANPVGRSFIQRDLISYYGYTLNECLFEDDILFPTGTSRIAPNIFCKEMEKKFLQRLATDKDSTGIANLKPDNKTEYFDIAKPSYGPSFYCDLFFRQYNANNYSYPKCGDTLTDARDKQKYLTVCIGKQNWMAQNLNYNAPGSITYDNNPANGPIYGRLYDLKTIMAGANSSEANPSGVRGICPEGWHVPSSAEFVTLFEEVGFDTAGGALKATVLWDEPNTGATNSSGFTGLPGGSASDITTPGTSLNLGKWGYFATTTNQDGLWEIFLLVYDGADIQGTNVPFEKQGVSCRCLKD